ncbi:dihydrofolate reductase [Lentisphaera profundi]|uniref:dihydrofolate reductase n=1 Tax=Lentisphaera profundi TaxID=1658616 RepID=A0ABY7VPT4_9BACT|nr:dihydrofolate reductase [Lentisphaera profundi]WDE96185.1 dihydrofolate reductase [Lentisphaera profundi]
MLSIISAMDENRLIGTGKSLPWNIPEEYQRYLSNVKGHTIIVGRKTFEISGKDLSNDRILILSKSHSGPNYFNNIEDAISAANGEDIFVTGGAEIYKQALAYADALYISVIKGDFEGSVYFPQIDPSIWYVDHHEELAQYNYYIYRRKLIDLIN